MEFFIGRPKVGRGLLQVFGPADRPSGLKRNRWFLSEKGAKPFSALPPANGRGARRRAFSLSSPPSPAFSSRPFRPSRSFGEAGAGGASRSAGRPFAFAAADGTIQS